MQFTALALADGEATGAAMAGYRQRGVRTGLGAGTEVRSGAGTEPSSSPR
jgi:hypothetical protein